MGDNQEKAKKMLEEANKKLGPWVLGGLFTSSSKTEEGLSMLARAANLFKMAKSWTEAGNTFSKIGSHHAWRRNKHEAATSFVAAANCYRKNDATQAISSLQKAVDIYLDMGRFVVVAKTHQTIAEIYETQSEIEKAMKHYELAADFFKGEDSNSSAKKCMVKVAEFSAQSEKYETAIGIYEQVGYEALESPLLKYGAKDYLFRSSICHLAVDVINARNAVNKYIDHYPAFEETREAKLVLTLCRHTEQQDVDQFSKALSQYQAVSSLDAWFLNILRKVMEQIPDENDLR